ncbi:MAG TPA: glycoside hydrolase family 43 protein [Tepidisphaeraceae bacterium]|nr:glycoside hydrolase family 43 protein [Tepidisphaeraceae bacterium]
MTLTATIAAGLAACAGIVFSATALGQTRPARYENPVVLQRADPWILKHTDGFYYMTASVPEYDRLEIRRSKTIQELGSVEPKIVWRKHAKGIMGAHIWAPELHRIGDSWYIYFAAGEAEKIWNIRIYVLSNSSADPMSGEWVERGQLKTNWESFALDSHTFEHKGRRYLTWAQNDPKLGRGTSVYIAEMSDPLHIKGEQVRITRPELRWEKIGHPVNEGPATLVRNGRIFLAYSASATDANYCMGLLTADENADLLDPNSWKKSPEPVMVTTKETGQYGPGHCSFTISEDGRTDLLVYHARPYEKVHPDPLRDPNRHARVQPITWNPDGTPNFGTPVADTRPTITRTPEGVTTKTAR